MQKKMEMILDMTLENEDVTGNNEYKRNDFGNNGYETKIAIEDDSKKTIP